MMKHAGIAVGLALMVSGCATVESGPERTHPPEKRGDEFWRPDLLFMDTETYPKLMVEVDYVDGSRPRQKTLDALADFLNRYLPRPEPVRVVLDDRISRGHARGRSFGSLGLEFIDGPSDDRTAFMYMLFFDSRDLKMPPSKPHMNRLPYPAAIYVDRQYFRFNRFLFPAWDRSMARHEAGHLVGLTFGLPYGDGAHCLDETCLMYWKVVVYYSDLFSRHDGVPQKDLCENCEKALILKAEEPRPDHLHFSGPRVVRSEEGYHVLSLPGFIYVHIGELADLDEAELEEGRQTAIKVNRNEEAFYAVSNTVEVEVVERMLDALDNDPYEGVRLIAKGLRDELEKMKRQ
ncbi:MAG: hypothetical protein AAF492_00920 [Verrucomicrobiota bacterium]